MATRRRQCENRPDAFCYICGCFTLIRQRRNITSFVRRAYKAYFELALEDQDKKWAHIFCFFTSIKCCVTGQKGNVRVYLSESHDLERTDAPHN